MLISLQLVLTSSSSIRKEGPSNYSLRFPRDVYDLLPLRYECEVWKAYSCPPPAIPEVWVLVRNNNMPHGVHSPIC